MRGVEYLKAFHLPPVNGKEVIKHNYRKIA